MVSIIIVNYNSKELLKNCLNSIANNIKISYEAIVVDNKSTDNSITQCDSIFNNNSNFKLIKLDENVGFSHANNIGEEKARGEIIHFLNPDTEVTNDLNNDYNQILNNPDKQVLYVNPLQNPNEEATYIQYEYPFINYYLKKKLFHKQSPMFYIGASIIVTRDTFRKLGRWDESFFMYAEDIAFFYQALKNDIKIIRLTAPIEHYGGGCSKNVWSSVQRQIMIMKSHYIFHKKYRHVSEYYIMQTIAAFQRLHVSFKAFIEYFKWIQMSISDK